MEFSVGKLMWGGLKQVLLEQNLTLNSDEASNYKYMFGPLRSPLHHSETHIIKKHCEETKQRAQWQSEARTQENH